MSDTAPLTPTGPGEYRTRDGSKATITHPVSTGWIGNVEGSERSVTWHPNGRRFRLESDPDFGKDWRNDIVAVWSD